MGKFKSWFSVFLGNETKRRNLLIVFFFFILEAIALISGNFINAIILAVFFLVYLLIRQMNYLLLIISLIAIFFWSTSTIDAFSRIKKSTIDTLVSPSTFYTNLFTKNTGQTKEVLDNDVLWMLSMIHKYDLKDYRISEALENRDTHQSIVESAWPIKMETSSKNVFIRIADIGAYSMCSVIERTEDYALIQCP
jgi:hypothetical protein